MTALMIILCFITLFIVMLNFSLRIKVRYYDEVFDFKIKYMFFKLYPLRERVKKEKKRKRRFDAGAGKDKAAPRPKSKRGGADKALSREKQSKSSNKDASRTKGLTETIEYIKGIADKLGEVWEDPQIKKITRLTLKSVMLDQMKLEFHVCGNDAYEAAMNYGTVSALTYNSLSAARLLFPISVKSINIVCDFDGKASRLNGKFDIKMRLPKLLKAGFLTLIWFFKNKHILLNR
ncbi:MAG: hypothetical protein FWG90_03235 [Oscillospiraceae bacterium]|nr:hypothetical protein [Oscillospiraceae bacterium]